MELKAENISFKYPSAKKYLLKNINLELDNNKVMGLIGDSGSGKSTLCKILSGYVTKYEGSVTFAPRKSNESKMENGSCLKRILGCA